MGEQGRSLREGKEEHLACQFRVERSRPASEPGGMECNSCGCIFIGAEWHALCAVCDAALKGGPDNG